MDVRLKKNQGLLFSAIPDSQSVRARVSERGSVEYVWPNSLVLSEKLKKALSGRSIKFYFPSPTPTTFKNVPWIINTCADADEYSRGLLGLDDAFGSSAPIFNHPRAVIASRRDKVASLPDGIDGLTVPKCIRFIPKKSQDFQKAFADAGMSYPVLVRPAASQTGRGLVRVDSPFDWVNVLNSHWYDVAHYMTQFVDFSNISSKCFEKVRVVALGHQIFVRAYSRADEWFVNSVPTTVAEATQYLDAHSSFSSGEAHWTTLARVAQEVCARLPLDFFGVDLGVRGDGTYVFFEANAAMNILTTSAKGSPKAVLDEIISRLEPAMKRYLEEADGWRHEARNHPPVRDSLSS
jgi:glutathione synthase/RimK-type ligase-like ATP-grasp enzyme